MSDNCNCHGGHCHHHHHEGGSIRGQIVKIVVATLLLVAAVVITRTLALPLWVELVIYLIPYFVAGAGVLRQSAEGIAHGDVFNENTLMTIATMGAMAIGFLPGGESEFAEAVFVMLFFLVGTAFEQHAEGRSKDSIAHLMDLKPQEAHVVRDGREVSVAPEDLVVGDVAVVRPGEKIPADGTVISGSSSLNTVALTGESEPREVAEGDQILSGCVNIQGALTIKIEKAYSDSTAAKVMRLVEESSQKKSRSEAFIARFARIYTPIVVFAALLTAVVPPLFMDGPYVPNFTIWLGRALTFLIISCPCALVISVPLTFFGGIGGASRRGILIKGASSIDALASLGTVVFDKTGTLTQGCFRVVDVCPVDYDARELLHLAAHVESFSTHPIAASIVEAYHEQTTEEFDDDVVTDLAEVAGHGLTASVSGQRVAVGNMRLMAREGAEAEEPKDAVGTVVHVAIGGRYVGYVVVSDVVKSDSHEAISGLHAHDIRSVMLTGDREAVARNVAAALGLDEWHSGLLPADKVCHVERLLESRRPGRTLAFVGDGINDAPVLARADVGIAMGALGSDAAIEAADVVLMDDKPSKVALAVDIAQRVIAIARQNVVFAIVVKVAVLALAAVGLAGMWLAVFADVGVTVIAVLNAMRALR